ncbi:hypothetical protein HHO41_14880 [Bacillus sp. DNRA2]|uniref:hypothetical protein n=1 Tax=Bacillus sp. DNRA2 TaxID=2723053 RepID=UPI00145D0C9B|nr:hypothetical protein [Bacillus sp. DNRA2]NMD71585.1 hypothetical protein [Bacillus sp. DNRA2]
MKLIYIISICILSLVINIFGAIHNFFANYNAMLSLILFLFVIIPRVLKKSLLDGYFDKEQNPLLQDQEIAEYNAKLGRRMVITNNLSLVFSLLIFYSGIAGSIWMQTVYTGQVQVITWLGWPVLIFATIIVTIDVINFLQKNS